MSTNPGPPALARSEGIVYESQKLLEVLQRMFRARRRVWVDGLPVLNRQPMEIDAAQAGMPRFVVREEQPAVRGAALLAGGSAGV